jgi:hypothetical protein
MTTGSVVSPRPYVSQDTGPQYAAPPGPDPDPAPGPVPVPQPRFTPRPPPFPRSRLLPPPVPGPRPRFTPHPQVTPQPQAPPRPRFIPRPDHPATRPAPAPARPAGWRHERPGRSVIGDELRIPIMWCEFGSCIERYTHADALGERDLRGRALTAGWCYDLLGRLACPACVQHDETFWASRPPVPAQRYWR